MKWPILVHNRRKLISNRPQQYLAIFEQKMAIYVPVYGSNRFQLNILFECWWRKNANIVVICPIPFPRRSITNAVLFGWLIQCQIKLKASESHKTYSSWKYVCLSAISTIWCYRFVSQIWTLKVSSPEHHQWKFHI